MENKQTGQLYVISTPIGNLKDITFRAIEILNNIDLILSEDTRETSKILKKYDIKTPQISYRDQNHDRVIEEIISKLKNGENLALVSDGGTPLISDPGYKLVSRLHDDNIKVVPIPGPSSVIAALSACGLPTDKFIFLGFLPKSPNKRKALLQQYGNLEATLVIFESPYRIVKLLNQVLDSLGNRTVCVSREITKLHEEFRKENVEVLINHYSRKPPKGECIVLVSK